MKELEPSRDNQSLSLQKLLDFDNQPGGQRRLTQVSSSVTTPSLRELTQISSTQTRDLDKNVNTVAGITVLHMAFASAVLELPTG